MSAHVGQVCRHSSITSYEPEPELCVRACVRESSGAPPAVT